MARSLIIVEGENDRKFIHSLAQSHGINISVENIFSAGDKDKAKRELKTQLKSTQKYETVSIVLDADENPEGTWQSVLSILEHSGKYNVKQNMPMPIGGTVIMPVNQSDICIGIWIMPNNQNVGMLEDFVASLIKEDDKIYEKAKEVVSDLDSHRAEFDKLFKHVHISKATIYTWLAWRDSPEQTMEQAVKKHLFDDLKMESENCKNFITWLNQVVDTSE